MSWLQVRIQATREQADAIESALLESGACSITLEDAADLPILEPELGETPLWPDLVVIGLFEADCETESVNRHLDVTLPFPTPAPGWEIVEDRAWEREWLSHFQPMLLADRLWVTPRGISVCERVEPHQRVIYLDPGLAFGTGGHATTALCLEWIAGQWWENRPLIDYGCGSGILALAALQLDCPHASAIDIDPQAIAATLENARRNRIDTSRLTIGKPGAARLQPASRLVANILAQPLVDLADTLAALVEPGGEICLSGITGAQAAAIAALYANWFEELQISTRDDWARITGTRRSAS